MENTGNITGATYASLKQQCEEVGISINQLCREAGVDRGTVERWKQRDPNTINILNALNEVLENKRKQINTHE
jgi:DNA transposition AAA+ family ATPase